MEASTTQGSADFSEPSERLEFVLRSAVPGQRAALVLDGGPWRLGRSEECQLKLEDSGVSRQHAEVERRGPLLTIRDLSSTNGTYVDGERVQHRPLAAGSVVRLGEWLGVVEQHQADSAPYHFRELAPGVWGGPGLALALLPLQRAASSTVPVVLVGTTGSGKERFAHALHALGAPGRVFRAVNCAALPPALAEAELFGYRRGSFTGAERNHQGHLRLAEDGTLFLDEVADLPLPVQAKLLRALDNGEMMPLGEAHPARFRARVVAACQESLSDLVTAGRFREDLANRLCGVVVHIPDLRERRGDIPGLFEQFLHRHSGGTAPRVSTRLYETLCLYDWPGNVREVELLARNLLAVHGLEPTLRPMHLPSELRGNRAAGRPTARHPGDALDDLTAALKTAGGNVKRAADLAGISRQRAHRLIASRNLRGVVSTSRREAPENDSD
jgi:transcriptional regulator with PAS, ATPase and Fis domain